MQYNDDNVSSDARDCHEKSTTGTMAITTEDIKSKAKVTAYHDLIAGGVAGSVSVVVGHPFDTIKVRMQMPRSGTSSMKSLSSSFGGMGSLFRGMAAPLSASAIVNAIIFASYGASSRLWDTYVHPSSIHNNTQNDPWQKAFVCGSFAGFVQCLVICPTEHLKCRLQVQQQHTNANNQLLFRGPIHASTAIFKTHGILGIYRGFVSTFWREVPAIGAYFATYDIFKDHISTNIQQRTGQPHPWLVSALSGGLAGCFSWIMIYPIDVIKTRIQTAPMDAPPQTLKMIPVGTAIIQQHGWRSLFRGLSVTLFRAFPVNMIIFPVYEFTLLQIT